MDDKPARRVVGGPAIVAAIVVLFVLLPLVYLLAIGPIVWLHRRGMVNVEPGSVIARVYYPAEMAAELCTPFRNSMEMYVSLWEPRQPPMQMAPPSYATLPAPPAAAANVAANPAAPVAATAPAGDAVPDSASPQ